MTASAGSGVRPGPRPRHYAPVQSKSGKPGRKHDPQSPCRIRIRLVMDPGEGGGTQSVPICTTSVLTGIQAQVSAIRRKCAPRSSRGPITWREQSASGRWASDRSIDSARLRAMANYADRLAGIMRICTGTDRSRLGACSRMRLCGRGPRFGCRVLSSAGPDQAGQGEAASAGAWQAVRRRCRGMSAGL